jgi:hypothetical protein
MSKDPSAFERPPMYGLFQASVHTREGKKIGGCNFDHRPNDFGMRKKIKKKEKKKGEKPYKTQLRKKRNTPIFGF